MDLDGDPDDEVTFGSELRRRRKAAGLSLKALAEAVFSDKGFISRVENGHRRPDELFARRCDERLGAGGELLALAVGMPGTCPYRGLAPFRAQDASWFFGRAQALSDLVCQLGDVGSEGHPVMVLGPSGVGKSSLLCAGLAPAVAQGALPGRVPGEPSVLYLTPTAHPVRELREQAGRRPLASHALLIVDQFEELFTLAPEGERESFADQLCDLARAGLPVVIGMRADFYGHCLTHPGLREALRVRSLPLGPMTAQEMRQAITEPAAAAGLTLEPGLVNVLMKDLGARDCETGALPLLSHALRATWQHRDDGRLTVAGYEATGGVHRAVATTAERAYAQLTPAGRETARRVLLSLVRVGDGSEADTRRRIDHTEHHEPAALSVVEEFTRARLLTADAGSVEISHEALLHAWPRLRQWIDADRVGLLLRQELADAASTWNGGDRDDSLLYRGSRLAAAEEWSAAHPARTTPLIEAFLKTGRCHEQRGIRRLRRLVAALAVLFLAATAALISTVVQKREADTRRDQATSARLVAQSDAVRRADPALAAQLAFAARKAARSAESDGALLSSSSTPYVTRYLGGGTDATVSAMSPDHRLIAVGTRRGRVAVWDTRGPAPHRPVILRVSASAVTRIAIDPHGVMAVAAATGPVRMWKLRDALAHDPPWTLPHSVGKVTGMAFSLDGTRLVTGDASGVLSLWDTTRISRPYRLHHWQGHTGQITDLSLSGDGRVLATIGTDHQAFTWGLTDPGNPARHRVEVPGSQPTLHAVALSADGHTLALTAYGRTCPVWLARVDAHAVTSRLNWLYASPNIAIDLALSPDGRTLAVGESDSTVRLWNTADHWGPFPLSLPARTGEGLTFGADGTSLHASTSDGGAYLWHSVVPPEGHRDAITTLQTSRDRPLAVTTSDDGTARLWDTTHDQPRPEGPMGCEGRPLDAAAISRDGRLAAVAASGFGARTPVCLWDITKPYRPKRVSHWYAHGDNSITSLAFSRDGTTLVTGGNDATAIAWDITRLSASSAPPAIAHLTRKEFVNVLSLTFLGGTKTVAIGTYQQGVQLWDTTSPRARPYLVALPVRGGAVGSLSANDDGTFLAAGSHDNNAYLWDLRNRAAKPHILRGHTAPVAVDITPDGTRLLTSTAVEGSARLWRVSGTRQPDVTIVYSGDTGRATLTSTGMMIAVSPAVRTLLIRPTDIDAIVGSVCTRAGAALTAQERGLYIPEPYRSPCP
ncbi:nSTAND1 domain-containing NTPase [Streptomyces sp. NPDC002276]